MEKEYLLLYVPVSLRKEILSIYHDNVLSSHRGILNTYLKIKEKYFWETLRNDVTEYVASCHECQTRKHPRIKEAGLLQPIKVGGPFERFGIDHVGPLPETEAYNRYVIVAVDYLTKWCVTQATDSTNTKNVVDFVINRIVCQFGSPIEILSDRGSGFCSEIAEIFYKSLNIKHLKTTSFHPQTNGMCEATNGIIGEMLSYHVSTDHKDWDQILPQITFAYNVSRHTSTNKSAFEMVYGIAPRLPIDPPLSLGVDESLWFNCVSKYLAKMHEVAKLSIENTQQRYTKYYNKKHREVAFNVGDEVLLYAPKAKKGKTKKFLHLWHGPYRIIDQLSPVVYKIESRQGKTVIKTAHVSHLKKYNLRKSEKNKETENTLENDSNEHLSASNNADQIQDTRKSSRRKQPSVRLADYYLFALSVILFLIQANAEIFHLHSPVLFRKYPKPVIRGYNHITLDLLYRSPCFTLKAHSRLYEKIGHLCEQDFNTKFEKPITSMCHIEGNASETTVQRNKRVAFVAVVIGAIVIAVASTIGVASYALVKEAQIESKIENYQKEQEDMLKRVEQTALNEVTTKQAFLELVENYEKLQDLADQTQWSLITWQNQIPKYIYVISEINSKLSTVEDDMFDIRNDWLKGEINSRLLKMFNTELPCRKECPLEMGLPINCSVNLRKQKAKFEFKVPMIAENTNVAKSDPFRIAEIKENKVCVKKYTGDKYLIIDEKNHCSIPAPLFDENQTQKFVFLPNNICEVPIKSQKYRNSWETQLCEDKKDFNPKSLIQLKFTNNYLYVYCFLNLITIYNQTYICPQFVFQLPIGISFQVGGYYYDTNRVQVNRKTEFDPLLSHKLNFVLTKKMNVSKINTTHLIKLINQIKPNNETNFIVLHQQNLINGVFVFIIIIIIVSVLTTCYCCEKRKRKASNAKPVRYVKTKDEAIYDDVLPEDTVASRLARRI